MLYLVGVLIFAFGLLASIALHEIGHMVPAKKFGVKVTHYMVGFGPTLWSRKRGDTEYGIKAVPLGGYIRMIGMVPPRPDGSRSRWPRRLATAVEEFRTVSRAEVKPEDEARQFYRLTPGKKMIVMLGGPTMNLLIYIVLTVLLLGTLGQKNPTTTVDSVTQCVVAANSPEATSDTCPTDAPKSPALEAGLRPGDTIEAINGQHIGSWNDAVSIIEASAGQHLTMTVRRNGADVTLPITPVKNVKYANADGTKTKEAGFLGVTAREGYAAMSPTQIPGQIVSQFAQGLRALGNYPNKIGSLWGTVFEGKKRDPAGAIGVVGIGRLGGQVADSHQLDLKDKIFFLTELLATVNLLLFFFNLLPLLPLDGGHVAGAIVEAAKRGRARLRARTQIGPDGTVAVTKPKPIYVDTAQMLPIMYGVASVLVVITLLVVYADIVKPVNIGG
ncbi:MAG TPA: site-2 protease family protein [Jatrophihabitantaceae bacterium]